MWKLFSGYSLSLSYYRFFFSLFLSFALSPISTRTRLTKMYIRDADSKIFARFRKLEAVCLLERCSFDSRPIRGREGNPPWKYEPRISITKSFVFVATQVNDNPTPCESNVNPSLCIYALLSRFIIRQI